MTTSQDELALDAFRSGFDTLSIAHALGRHEAQILASIHRARTAEIERRQSTINVVRAA